jgi:two-component system KDP operon response regulator KdpE
MEAPADRTHEQHIKTVPARIAVVSGSDIRTAAWYRRNMLLVRIQSRVAERLLADPPDVILLDAATIDAQLEAACWQVHDLLHIPIVVVADALPTKAAVDLLDRGAEDVVAGPPDSPLLAARVAAILRRRRGEALRRMPPLLRFPGVEIDMVRRVVRRGATTRSLSRTEFSLLVALFQAGGRPCLHRDLLRQVWRSDDPSATPYLRLYIRYLREKLEEDPRHPRLIVNVWGTGYRLVLAEGAAQPDAGSSRVFLDPPSAVAIPSLGEVTWPSHSSSSVLPPTSRVTPLASRRTASR